MEFFAFVAFVASAESSVNFQAQARGPEKSSG